MEDFLLGIGQMDALLLLEERGLTWPKLLKQQENDLLNSGLPKRIALAIAEGLKAEPASRMHPSASRARLVINLEAKNNVEMDYESLPDAELPPLPKEAPPIASRIEYKNYMRLRYEHQKRGLLEGDNAPPRPSPRASQAAPSPRGSATPLSGEPLKSPKKRPQRAAPPPPSIPPFGAVVAAKQAEPSPPVVVAAVVPPKPAPVVAPAPEIAEPQERKSARKELASNPHRLTEMFATMELKLAVQSSASKHEEPKKTEVKHVAMAPKKVGKKEPEVVADANLSEMLDEIEDDMADIDELILPAGAKKQVKSKKMPQNDADLMRKSHLEQLSEVLAEADELEATVSMEDSFFQSEVEEKLPAKKEETPPRKPLPAESDSGVVEAVETAKAEVTPRNKPLPRETNASEIYGDVSDEKGEGKDEKEIDSEGEGEGEGDNGSDAKQEMGEKDSDSDSEMELPMTQPVAQSDMDSELPSLPPVESSSDESE